MHRVTVVLGIAIQLLGYLEHAQVIRVVLDFLGGLIEDLVYVSENDIARLARQYLADHFLARLLGKYAPIAAYHV